jgi:glycosyltransferase involved in cell wall biosynthesis
MAAKVPLSVVILTKNEAKRIADCIQSVRWADEILVIDDESTDNTVALAEALGARVLRRKMDVEGRHRNWANAQAKHEWILSLDADERVTPELAEELRSMLAGPAAPAHQTYAIPRRNHIGTRWIRYGGWYPSAQLKLWQRSVMRWEEASVHPRAFADCRCGQTQHDIIHYTYRDLRDFVDKMNRHTTLEAEKWVAAQREMPLRKALWRTLDRFVRAYVGKQGFREGFMGFIVAALGGWYQLLSYAKYREMKEAR